MFLFVVVCASCLAEYQQCTGEDKAEDFQEEELEFLVKVEETVLSR